MIVTKVFRIKYLKFFFLNFISITLFVSCIDKPSSLDDAFFIVEEITPQKNNVNPVILHKREGIIDSFSLNLEACLKDIFTKEPILGTSFIVEYETTLRDQNRVKGKFQKVKVSPDPVSNSNGCIQWVENYPFRFVKNPKWINLKRVIKTENINYFGQETVPMAINPWLISSNLNNNLPEIMDLRPQYSKNNPLLKNKYHEDGLSFLSDTSAVHTNEYPHLFVPEIDLQIQALPPQISEKNFM